MDTPSLKVRSMPRIYIASGMQNWSMIRELYETVRGRGVEITYDWTPWAEELSSGGELRPDNELCNIAIDEICGVLFADAVLAVMPGGVGTHFEMSTAWNNFVPVVIALNGHKTNFHCLPRMERYEKTDDALHHAIELAWEVHDLKKFQPPENVSAPVRIASRLVGQTVPQI